MSNPSFQSIVRMRSHSEKRCRERSVPPRLVTASMLSGGVPAFGVLADLSPSGARVAVDQSFDRGRELRLAIGFSSDPDLFAVNAVVIWNRGDAAGGPAGVLHGLRFVGLSAEERSRLSTALRSAEFQENGVSSDAGASALGN